MIPRVVWLEGATMATIRFSRALADRQPDPAGRPWGGAASGGPARTAPGMRGRNPVNPAKLPGSKWTAVRPENREKHFVVRNWVRDADGRPTDEVEIEAILTRVVRVLRWRELEDWDRWRIGWI